MGFFDIFILHHFLFYTSFIHLNFLLRVLITYNNYIYDFTRRFVFFLNLFIRLRVMKIYINDRFDELASLGI